MLGTLYPKNGSFYYHSLFIIQKMQVKKITWLVRSFDLSQNSIDYTHLLWERSLHFFKFITLRACLCIQSAIVSCIHSI